MAPAGRASSRWLLAGLASALFVAQAVAHVARGELNDLLWICNVAPCVLAISCAAAEARGVAAAVCWLAFGTPMWLLDLLGGGSFMITSLTTHLGGLLVGLAGVRLLGWRRGSWLWACAGLLLVMLASRGLTAPSANVNLVFGVWSGWERLVPNHTLYLALLGALASASFYAVERAAMRWPGAHPLESVNPEVG